MPENWQDKTQKPGKVIFETVAFRYSDNMSLMLVGEAEIVIELFTDSEEETANNANLKSVWVDLLSVFDAEDRDVFQWAISDPVLKQALAQAALEHYLHPPAVPVGLPGRIREW